MLNIDLKGKVVFIAGVGDDNGFGWAIGKALAEAGAKILIGTWPPMLRIFSQSLTSGKFDESRKLQDGSLLHIDKIYPLDASFDKPEDVPEDIKENKRYKDVGGYTISEVVDAVQRDYGSIDILIHAIANAPEVQKPLLETSRKGYLAAISSSSYSFVSLLQYFGKIMNPGGSAITLTYVASQMVIPGYGGGMSSAKAALESDIKTLSFEAGREFGVRVNAISAGAYASRAAKAIGFIERMISYTESNSPLKRPINAADVAYTTAFLASTLASGITGEVIFVDSGMHAMGVALDSKSLECTACS